MTCLNSREFTLASFDGTTGGASVIETKWNSGKNFGVPHLPKRRTKMLEQTQKANSDF